MTENENAEWAKLRPFERLPFVERTDEEVAAGVVKEADAHAALQSLLSRRSLNIVTPELAKQVLSRFGVEGQQARTVLVELWQHAFKKLLFRDDQVDHGEHAYLDRLQDALGLSADEIRAARAQVPDVSRDV
jgi:hypothetical protein